jgi:hypothetical protein
LFRHGRAGKPLHPLFQVSWIPAVQAELGSAKTLGMTVKWAWIILSGVGDEFELQDLR